MGVTLRQVHVENFRSIQRLTIPAAPLSILVGKNDCGKSNVLRALNLFFNGVTNPGKSFLFEEDYNLYVPQREKVAREVLVRVELDIPESYWETNGQVIVWEKRWRASGQSLDHYWGYRLKRNRRGREVQERVEIPERSNAHALLRQIEFQYVPAIKDANYFDGLRGRIYSIIAEVAARTFRTSSAAFEESIGEHLRDLTVGIGEALKIDTRLALPRDLSHIFERLDFLSGEKAISLDQRGDGVKTRHIPMILEFMANKKRSLQVRGAMPYSFIWAYEEPENNLEFASAVELGDQLYDLASKGVAQVLLTTHSPVFYDLTSKHETRVSRSHVFRDLDATGTQVSTTANEIDEKLGTLALLAPRVGRVVQEVRDQLEARAAAAELLRQNRPKVFVEGESDRIVMRRCLELFHPARAGAVDLETKLAGGGHGYVIDMLKGWRAHHKHHPEGPKAAGLLDCDAASKKREWNETAGNVQSAKAFCYPLPPHAIAAKAAHFRMDVTLETLYDSVFWTWADEHGMLAPRTLSDVYPQDLVERLLRREPVDEGAIDPAFEIFVHKCFGPGTKIRAAQQVARLPDERLRSMLAGLAQALGAVLDYLGVEEPAAAEAEADAAAVDPEDVAA